MAASMSRGSFIAILKRNGFRFRNLSPVMRFSKTAYVCVAKQDVKEVRQSKAEMAYAAKKFTYDELYRREVEEFERGKRHLANMMGEDPENFTQKDIDKAIHYLLPSGLFAKHARPLMKHPSEIFPPQKESQVDATGRPYDYMFYTGKPNFYNLMHDTYAKFLEVQKIEDKNLAKGIHEPAEKIYLTRSVWIDKKALDKIVLENISDHDYNRFIRLLERIIEQPYAIHVQDYIIKYRKDLVTVTSVDLVETTKYDENGIGYMEAEGKRKQAHAHVIVREKGTGKVTVNGRVLIDYFSHIEDREQVMFPFQFLDKLGDFDMECKVSGGGTAGQAGAIRLASSRALRSFINEEQIEYMRQAGLLTQDPRIVERKKPGQKGARKKFTWKKR